MSSHEVWVLRMADFSSNLYTQYYDDDDDDDDIIITYPFSMEFTGFLPCRRIAPRRMYFKVANGEGPHRWGPTVLTTSATFSLVLYLIVHMLVYICIIMFICTCLCLYVFMLCLFLFFSLYTTLSWCSWRKGVHNTSKWYVSLRLPAYPFG